MKLLDQFLLTTWLQNLGRWRREITQIDTPPLSLSLFFFFFFLSIFNSAGGVEKGHYQNRTSDRLKPQLNQQLIPDNPFWSNIGTASNGSYQATKTVQSHRCLQKSAVLSVRGPRGQHEGNRAEKSSVWRPPLWHVAQSASWWAARDNHVPWKRARLAF